MKRGKLAFELCSTNIHDIILAQQYRLDGVELCNILRYGGADTVVFACLDEHYRIDLRFMEIVRSVCKSKTLCFHRAFDDIPDKEKAIQQLITLGVNRILTSGGMPTAIQGVKALNQFNEWANGAIEIMAGAGINEVDFTSHSQRPFPIHFLP